MNSCDVVIHFDEYQTLLTKRFSKEKTKETCSASQAGLAWFSGSRRSQAEEGLGTGLAADVDNVVSVGETVELSGRALGVGTHVLKVQPVADVKNGVEASAVSDAINTVAGRTPDRVLEALAHGSGFSSSSLKEGLSGSAEDLCDGLLVVKHDVGEVSVDTIVDVEHVTLAIKSGVLNGAAGDDVAGNGESRGNIVTAGLGDDFDVAVRREEFVESATEHGGHGLKSVATEATTNVEGAHGKAKVAGLLENGMGVANGLEEGKRIGSTRANVEADSNNVETKVLGESEKTLGGVHGSTKLHAEAAQGLAVVGHNAEEELGSWVELGDLVELVGIVKGHLLDAYRLDVSDVRVGLAGLGVDDAVGAEA